MTRPLTKNVRIAIVAAGTFTFWKMDFKHVLHDQNIDKKREDRHRSHRDIYILKNGFQTYSSWPEDCQKHEDRHHSRRDIYILKNLISSVFFITGTLSKNMRIAIVAAGTFTFWKTWFQACSSWPEHCQKTWGSPSYPPGHLHFEKLDFKHVLHDQNIAKNVRIAIVAVGTFTFWKTWFQACSSWPEHW